MRIWRRIKFKDLLKKYIDRQIDRQVEAKIELALSEYVVGGTSEIVTQSESIRLKIQSHLDLTIGAVSDLANLFSGRKTNSIKSISIIIPTKNRFNLLLKALNSCAWQTRSPNEIIIVNDGRIFTETERAQITEIITGDCSLVILDNKYGGAAGARKTGVQFASSEILTYLDDDNLMWPTWLETVDREFSLASDQLIYGAQLRKGLRNNILAHSNYSHQRLCESNFIDTSSIAHHKNFGQWDSNINILEDDWDFILSIASRENSSIRYVSEISSIYFTDADNRISNTKKGGANVLSKKYKTFFDFHLK